MSTITLLCLLLATPRTVTAQTPTTNSGRVSSYTPCPQVPTLHCRNGSTCLSGQAKYSKEDIAALSYIQTHEEGYYCECLPGYIGHECEIEVSDCASSEGGVGEGGYDPTELSMHRCYHGSTCKRKDDRHYCDCETINARTADTGLKFAGLMCEHEATSLCAVSLVENYAPNEQFCTNHGKCVKLVSGSDPHPGCVCRDGWGGDRCELRTEDASISKLTGENAEGGGNPTAKWVLFSLLVAAMSCIAIAVVFLLIKTKQEKRGPSPKAVGKTPTELGLGCVEPDGSGTLGQSLDDEGTDASKTEEGDLEMKENAGEAIDEESNVKVEDGVIT